MLPLFLLLIFHIELQSKDKKEIIDKLQSLERQIGLEIETSRAKGFIKGTYVAIYSNSRKILEINEGIQADSPFPILSISQIFTGFAILKLNEGGYLKFHDPVTKHIPEFREVSFLGEPITIEDLLHHLSGIPTFDGTSWINFSLGGIDYEIPKQTHPSRKKFVYSEHNYRILAKVVENVSNQTLKDYLSEILFTALNMRSINIENYDGATGISISANDLLKFSNLILHSGKVNDTQFTMKKTIKNFFRKPKNLGNKNFYYRAGWFIEIDKKNISKIWNNGKDENFYSSLKIYPREKIIFIIFNQGTKKSPDVFFKMNSNLEKWTQEYIQNFLRFEVKK